MAISAADAYQAVVEKDPEDAEAYLNLGKLRLSLKQVPQALEALRRHLALAPRSDEGAFLAAQALLRLSRQDEAIALLEEYVKLRPDSPQLLVALMESCEGAERLQEAAAAGERLLQLRFDALRTRLALARINLRLGRHDEAVVHLTEAAHVMDARGSEFTDADRAEISLRIVQVLLDAGHPQEALASAGSGADRFPADPRFELKKGEALLMQGLPDRAEKLFQETRSTHKDDDSRLVAQVSDVYLSAGARLERAKDYEGAEKHLKRAIEVNPDNGQALNYLGYMLADRSVHLDEAIGYIRRALDRDPDNGAYLDSLGWAYFRKGEYVRAEKALASAIAALPDEAEIHAHMGELYQATGRLTDAIEAWQDALRHGIPNAEDIRAKVAAAQEKTAPAPR
jgi:tetratricopeptide (TPR) repeat protein